MSEDDLLPRALVINNDDDDDAFDLNIPATSGNEYLRRVRQEAKECPQVVVASLDSTVFTNRQTVKYKEPSGCLPAPKGLAPSSAWQKTQVASFVELRQKLARMKSMLVKGELKVTKPILPSANDTENWCRLCFGRLKVKREQKESSSGEEPMIQNGAGQEITVADYDICSDALPHENTNQGTPPLLSIILFMDQLMVLNVLEYHINWLEATGFTSHQGRWFYALLAILQKPLVPEACSLIRDLARLCSNLRASLDSPSDGRLNELNLMIVLVSQYFEQVDLAP